MSNFSPEVLRAEREQLMSTLCRHSVRFGTFTLASGKTSDVYVDAKLTTCRARSIPLIGRLFLQKFTESGWMPVAVGGLTMGADPIAMAVARESLDFAPSPINAFIVRKQAKEHGMRRYIEGIESTEGASVVIIDDVCSTGGSTATAVEYAKASGMNVLGCVCLVDREMGASELLFKNFGCRLESIFQISELRQFHEHQHEDIASAVGAVLF